MNDYHLKNQSRGGALLPASSTSVTSTSAAQVLGMMPMTVPPGMHPPVGMMPNVGNNYPTPQQIPLTSQHNWAIGPPIQGLQPPVVVSLSSNNDHNRSQFFSNSIHLGGNIENSNVNLSGGNNVTVPDEDDDTSLSDAPDEEEERRADDMAIEASDEEENTESQKSNQILLPKALEDVLAFKDQRAAEYDGDIIDESVANFRENSSNIDNNERKVHLVGMENIQAKDINFTKEADDIYEEGDDVEQDSANELEDNDNTNGNLNGAEQQQKSLQQSRSERNKRKKRRKKLNKKLKRQQQQQQQQHLQSGNVQNNIDNEKSKDSAENHSKEPLANDKTSEKLSINGQEKYSDVENKKNTASLKVSSATVSDTDKSSTRHSSEKKGTHNDESINSKDNEENVIIE